MPSGASVHLHLTGAGSGLLVGAGFGLRLGLGAAGLAGGAVVGAVALVLLLLWFFHPRFGPVDDRTADPFQLLGKEPKVTSAAHRP